MSASATPSPIIVQRELHLPTLPQFLVGLQTSLQAKGHSPEKAKELISTHVSAECIACQIKINGNDLLLLDPQSAVMDVLPKITRLRQGYCARQTCETYFYRVNMANQPDLDWALLMPQAENSVEEQKAGPTAEEIAAKRIKRKNLAIRLSIAGAVLLVLLLVKQIYQGGRIPLIRSPEKFEVDRTLPPDLMRR